MNTGSVTTVTPDNGGLVAVANPVVWVEDSLPTGAVPGTEGGDSWDWVSSNPSPYSGNKATLSSISAGFHQYFFSGSSQTLQVNGGDVLFAHVYIDPSNVPSELMLQWNDGTWEHRAYWGASLLSYGTEGTVGRAYAGPLPQTGQWLQIKVPASLVGLAIAQHGRSGWLPIVGGIATFALLSRKGRRLRGCA